MKNILFPLLFISVSKLCFAQDVLDKEKLFEFYQNQKYAEAATYLSSVYHPETTDIKALTQIAYCNMMAGRLPDAEKNYLKINQLNPDQTPILFNLVNINSKKGNYKNATAYLRQIINIDSTHFNAYKQLAYYTDSILLKIQYLEKANQLNPNEADVAYELAFCYKYQKRWPQAYNILKTAIAADTGNLILKKALLPICNQLNKYAEVVNLGEAILANDTDASVIKDLAKAYFFLKNYQKAISLYQLLENMDMQNESTFYYTSLSYRELKNYTKASEYAKKTITEGISSNTSAYYSLLAGIYEERNQLLQAATAYKKGLTFDSNKNIYYRLGLLYDLKLNQPKTALIYYNNYLKSKDLNKEDQPQIDYVKSRLALPNK